MKTLFASVRARRSSFQLALATLGAAASLVGLSACAASDQPRDNSAMIPEDQRVSSQPWNEPQKWEQTGQLGQLANDPRFANH